MENTDKSIKYMKIEKSVMEFFRNNMSDVKFTTDFLNLMENLIHSYKLVFKHTLETKIETMNEEYNRLSRLSNLYLKIRNPTVKDTEININTERKMSVVYHEIQNYKESIKRIEL